MTLRFICAFALLLFGTVGLACAQEKAPAPAQAAPADPADRWEKAIAAFEMRDKENPPPKGAVLFVGSSSIGGWKTLAEDFPGVTTLNRGFGGSGMADLVRYADRIVIPYAPRHIVVYTGENDIASKGAAKRTAEQVFENFKRFVRHVREKLPAETRITFISMKPSPSRWHLWPEMQKGNALIRAWLLSGEAGSVSYVDVGAHMLGPDGKPRPELYVKDNLHMTAEGYKVWTRLMRPVMTAEPTP